MSRSPGNPLDAPRHKLAVAYNANAGLGKRFQRLQRIPVPERNVEERITDFCEVAPGYSPDQARAEASRCLAGRIEGCIQCGE